MRFILALIRIGLILLSVAACSTVAQREATRMNDAFAQADIQSTSCTNSVYSNPDYAQIGKKLYFVTGSPSPQFPLQYLTDQSKPTKSEIALLYKLYGDIQGCRKIELEGIAKANPLVVTALISEYSTADRIWTDAVTGKLTWGKFNELRKALLADFQVNLAEVKAKINAELQNEHQFEIEQRQRAVAAMQQWTYQQQQLRQNQEAINAADRSRTINCNYYGDTMRCTSD
jgi:hypothetical protein